MIVGTAGHIDHGKTALIHALTGVDTARLKEEKRRGITIDLGFAYKALPDASILGFIDVPGHEKFLHNMLAGITGIDFALLVVAADDGPMPQTLEHAAILHLLGVSQGIVAITKSDLASGARVAEVTARIHDLLLGTAMGGYPVVPVSTKTGTGVAQLESILLAAAAAQPARAVHGHFRLAVDRCFTLSGAGTVVTGTVFSGCVANGERLLVSPTGIEVRVRGVYAQNRPCEAGICGQRCALNLSGPRLKKSDIKRGDWIVGTPAHAPTERFDADLFVLPGEARALRHWTPVHVHIGAAFAPGRVAVLEGKAAAPGETVAVQLVLDRPIGAFHGDRFILRDQSAQRTIGGGRVIDPFPPASGRRTAKRLAVLGAIRQTTPATALHDLLELCSDGIDLQAFARARNLTVSEAEGLFQDLGTIRMCVSGKTCGFNPKRMATLHEVALAALRRYHAARPHSAGATALEVEADGAQELGLPVLAAVLEDLAAAGTIGRAGALFRLRSHRPTLSSAEQRLRETLLSALRSAGCRPPRVRELAQSAAADEKLVRSVLQRLAGEGELYPISDQFYFSRDAVCELALRANALLEQQPDGTASVIALREGLGMGRNLLIELLEFFDRQGFTTRVLKGRRLRRDPRTVFPVNRGAFLGRQA